MSLNLILKEDRVKRPKITAIRRVDSVTRIWTSSKGVIPLLKRVFPAVPEDAHKMAAAIMYI